MVQPNRARQPKTFDVNRTLPNRTLPIGARRQPPQSPKMEPPKLKKSFSTKKALTLLLILVLVPILVIGIWDLKNFSSASSKLFGSGNVINVLTPKTLEGADAGRVNLLLVGYSADDPGHAGATLTDSILILSLDKTEKTGYMLSIPRDLYVSIPGSGYGKINEVYQYGQNDSFNEIGYSAGGMGLLEKVFAENFKIPVHYNALINYNAVRDIVAAVDGITVDIKSSDQRGLYDPNFRPHEGGELRLPNGTQEIDSQTALKLTRARGATFGSYGFEQSDFIRTQHQRQILSAIKQKLTWQRILNPLENKPLFDAAANNVKTDIRVNEILPLYRLFNAVPDSKLRSIGLRDTTGGVSLLRSYSTPSGQSALIPAAGIDDYSQIHDFILRINQ